MRPLSNRLAAIAAAIPAGLPVADIGTDHAYLPIFLRLTGQSPRVIACDLRPGPLETARANVAAAGVDGIELRLGDGLAPVAPAEANVIVIAGMGGEEVAAILAAAPWLRDPAYLLVLQPMTSPEALRQYLSDYGFFPLQERFVQDDGRPYSVISARYSGKTGGYAGAALYIGLAGALGAPEDIAAYRQKQWRRLSGEAAQKARVPALQQEALQQEALAAEIAAILADELPASQGTPFCTGLGAASAPTENHKT